jgi:hypothetical protein
VSRHFLLSKVSRLAPWPSHPAVSGWSVNLTTHCVALLSLRMSEAVHLLPIHVLFAWTHTTFIFFFTVSQVVRHDLGSPGCDTGSVGECGITCPLTQCHILSNAAVRATSRTIACLSCTRAFHIFSSVHEMHYNCC